MGEACRAAALCFEMRTKPEDGGGSSGNEFDPEDAERCPCCGSRLEQRGVQASRLLSVLAGIVLAVVGFGAGSGALSFGAPGAFGNSVVGVVLVVAGAVAFLWGLAGVLSHLPAVRECPSCGYRREER